MRRILAMLLSAICVICWCPGTFAASSATVEFYVANGATDGDGSIDKPFGSIQEAQMAIREYKAQSSNGLPKGGAVVYLRGGEYFLTESVNFTAEDAGELGCPITYTSFKGEEVVLIGGIQLDGKAFTKTTDEAVLSRVIESSARSHIMEFDLKTIGVTDYGELNYPGAYPLPWLEHMTPAPELFYNDDAMTLARYPNGDDKLTVGEIITPGPLGSSFKEKPEDGDPNFYGFTIAYSSSRIDKWAGVEGIKMQGNWVYNWADSTVDVKTVDPKAKTITSVQPHHYGIAKGQPFYAYNLLEELDAPGEYYLDRSTGILYFYPPDDGMAGATIHLSLMEGNVFNFTDAEYIIIDGLTVTAIRNRVAQLNDADYITFSNMKIRNTSALACIRGSAENLLVTSSEFINVNGGLDVTGGNVETLEHSNNILENSYFRNFARHKKNYNPAVIFRGCGAIIRHNEMHDAPHSAILGLECEDIVEYNEIYDVCLESSDAGAIYWGSNPVNRGCVIRYNYIHDIHDPTGHEYTHALYADDCDAGMTIFGNVIENVSSPAVMINGGRNNEVRNNIFINCNTPWWMTNAGFNLSRDRWAYPNGRYIGMLNEPYVKSPIYLERYPEVAETLSDDPQSAKYSCFESNIMINCGENNVASENSKVVSVKDNLWYDDDPGFADMKKRNYAQAENFIAFTEIPNFAPIDFANIGRFGANMGEQLEGVVALVADSPYAYVNGAKQAIDAENPEIAAKVINGRTVVPIRFISETFGAIVKWDASTNQAVVKYRGNAISFPVGENVYYKNGEAVETETGAVNLDGRVLVPLRAVVESLDKKVLWQPSGLIAIYSDDSVAETLSDANVAESIINNLR